MSVANRVPDKKAESPHSTVKRDLVSHTAILIKTKCNGLYSYSAILGAGLIFFIGDFLAAVGGMDCLRF